MNSYACAIGHDGQKRNIMNTYIIDKSIKAAVIEKHFFQLSWLIKAIGKDEEKTKRWLIYILPMEFIILAMVIG